MIGSAVWKGPVGVCLRAGWCCQWLGAPPLPRMWALFWSRSRQWVTARSVPTVTNDDIGRDIPCEHRAAYNMAGIRRFKDSTSSTCLSRTIQTNCGLPGLRDCLKGCCDTLTYLCLTARPPRLLAFRAYRNQHIQHGIPPHRSVLRFSAPPSRGPPA